MIFWAHPDDNRPLFENVSGFIAQTIFGDRRYMGEGTVMGITQGDKLIAGVIFHNYSPEAGTIEFSGGGTKPWFTRKVIWEVFNYIFNELGCQAAYSRTPESNTQHINVLKRYGFETHIIPHLRGRNKGEAISVLTSDAWRANGYHKENKDGQSTVSDAA